MPRRHLTNRLHRKLGSTFALLAVVSLMAASAAGGVTPAEPAWTTYHRDAERTGSDPDASAAVTPVLAWQSPDLGAPIWGQPLILGPRVFVATVGDGMYALDAATGRVLWHASAGMPVPSGALPCGDITPTVGIVGTPVIDAAAGVIYAVADTWDGSSARHELEGFRLSDGLRVLDTAVDPAGSDPKAQLQRTALNLDGANVVFGFGGNDGDCSDYRGAVASVPESGGAPSFWRTPIAAPSSTGGAVWATGGPAVDAGGHIFASTGNPNPPSGQEASTYDYSDSVVELNSSLNLIGHFEPSSWKQDSNTDRDLGSGAPELLPGGLLFEAGKNGTGYLVDEASLAVGATAVYSHQVCGGAGSFGGDSYLAGVIYVPCTSGVQALSYDAAARTFTPLWQGPADAVGPPILSAGLVWDVANGGSGGASKLYGLDPLSGKPRYTETLASKVADHFASPSAAGGRVLVATGSTVTAYQVATLTPSQVAAPTPYQGATLAPSNGAQEPGGVAGAAPLHALGSPGAASPAAVTLLLASLHANHRGSLRLRLACPAALLCSGKVTVRALLGVVTGHGHLRHLRTVMVTITRRSFTGHRGRFTLTLRLSRGGLALLHRHHRHLRVVVTIMQPARPPSSFSARLSG